MINPGRETNYPTSSGSVNGTSGVYGKQLANVNGMTITLGMVLLFIVGLIVWQMLYPRRRK